ncbi:MAG: class I SAM-dependent methyltransferase [Methylomicrobium sp.]
MSLVRRLPVVFSALLAQIGALLTAFLAFKSSLFFGLLLPLWLLVLLHSAMAVVLSGFLRMPFWWLAIQGLFVPLLLMTLSLNLPPSLFLAGFILLWLIFFSNTRERVPLYLSNETSCQALATLLPKERHFRFLDLGCGVGEVLVSLAEHKPEGLFYGVESAPLPFLVSWLRLKKKNNAHVRYGNLWNENLAAYDIVYAFLSPEPMIDLWRKAKNEMQTGSLFISNSFAVPGCPPARILEVNDARRTHLLIWEM